MSTDKEKKLFYLEELSNYKIADSDKDVRGWEVKGKEGLVIGKVDNLLVNKTKERVVYLDVEVDASIIEANHKPYNAKAQDGVHEFINADGENHLIIPIGLAHLNLESKIVFAKSVNHKTFAETKRIKKGTLVDRNYEVDVLSNYDRNNTDTNFPLDDTLYDRPEFYINF
ncbi:photosystem reaction center subunit H [Bizionia gelidisalsuginis]|uniref:Photosystem reaction center subunit H n=1 Tax=Bizionia gelidisalsuginis TaxID=291188 RepID=A0ABY3M7T7_9FLAO|nr:photosystem reaction center subunit H [Bizionia gelidisalsuginis]TYC09586.1 photosystem reaction center subunit H [Bizionia gelidisalsuginis]